MSKVGGGTGTGTGIFIEKIQQLQKNLGNKKASGSESVRFDGKSLYVKNRETNTSPNWFQKQNRHRKYEKAAKHLKNLATQQLENSTKLSGKEIEKIVETIFKSAMNGPENPRIDRGVLKKLETEFAAKLDGKEVAQKDPAAGTAPGAAASTAGVSSGITGVSSGITGVSSGIKGMNKLTKLIEDGFRECLEKTQGLSEDEDKVQKSAGDVIKNILAERADDNQLKNFISKSLVNDIKSKIIDEIGLGYRIGGGKSKSDLYEEYFKTGIEKFCSGSGTSSNDRKNNTGVVDSSRYA